jgi:hypothetical protein
VRQRLEATFILNPVNSINMATIEMGHGFGCPLPIAQWNLRYVVVVVEYFSKWIVAKALATITSITIQTFYWQNIICRFRVPKALTVNNGTQFDSETFKSFCNQVGMNIHFAFVRHLEYNGLLERPSDIILLGIMRSIFNLPKGKLADELIKVVWNHNTSVSRSTRFTAFKLLYGDESITPKEAKTGSTQVIPLANHKISKDTIERIRLQAIHHINKYQAEIAKWRDRNVKLKNTKPDHLVLRRIANLETVGKLQFKLEGPFLVISSGRLGSYMLKDMDGNEVPTSWNTDELHRYYV